MHPEAHAYVERAVGLHGPFGSVVEFGGRDVNGSVRSLFGDVPYLSIDREPGNGVDVVHDAASFHLDAIWECVVCCEVLEHAENAEEICAAAAKALAPRGVFVMTCAGEGRAPHSALDGGPLREGEFYRNVTYQDINAWFFSAGFTGWEMDVQGTDMRCTAWRAA